MVHYIDKDRIVAEIERRRSRNSRNKLNLAAAFEDNYLLSFIDSLEVKELPIWEKVSPDTGQTTLYKDGNKSYLERFGYRIDVKELDKLPKNNSTHRTPADIESAMQEVEAKSEAYTNAHRGERDDDVLSQMRGEPVSEELEVSSKEWLRPQLDKSYANYGETKMMELTRFDGYAMLEAIEFGAKWEEEQFEKNRLEHCNSITNEQAELEQKFVDQHLDKHNRIPTFLDAIEYGMEIEKKKPKSHKGKGAECAECADYWKKKGIEIGKKKK